MASAAAPDGGNGRSGRLANALGVFSVGLGLAEVAAPRAVARAIGLADPAPGTERLLRGFGVREMVSGFGLLRNKRPRSWLWSRVAGDVIDLAFLGQKLGEPGVRRGRLGAATAAVAAVTALDLVASTRRRSNGARAAARQPADRVAVVTINRPAADVYRFWRRLENLPLFMGHLESVEVLDERRSRWTAEAAGTRVSWEAEIVDDEPEHRMAWRSLPGADVANEGSVTFRPAPGGRGTEVRVTMSWAPPAGAVGAAFARLVGQDPGALAQSDLEGLKQILETGEIATTAGQPHGRRSLVGKGLDAIERRTQS